MAPPILSKPSKAAQMAILYVTVGALLMVWSGVWYAWMIHQGSPDANQPRSDGYMYLCYAIFFSGLTVFIIGLALGRIGRAARHAEMPPEVSGAPTAQPAIAAAPAAPAQAPAVMQPVGAVPSVANTAPVAQVR